MPKRNLATTRLEGGLRLRLHSLCAKGQTTDRSCLSLHRLPTPDRRTVRDQCLDRKAKVELLSSNPASFKFDTGGRDNSVHFCPQCGTYVWTEYMPGFCFVRACTLDEQNALIPDVHIFARSKQPWLDLPGDIPVHEVYYDRDKVWPDDSLARFAAVTASMK
jgi:hypothetical protein